MKHPVSIELTIHCLLAQIAKAYTTRGALSYEHSYYEINWNYRSLKNKEDKHEGQIRSLSESLQHTTLQVFI